MVHDAKTRGEALEGEEEARVAHFVRVRADGRD